MPPPPARPRGWGGGPFAYLDKPWLELVVDDDVVPIALEAVPVVGHDGCHGFEGVHHQPRDGREQPLRHFPAPSALQVKAQVLDT